MKRLLCISGLGADRRAFSRLEFPSGWQVVFVDWIMPLANESLENYACRLVHEYAISEKDTLLGLSFGGLVAQYIAEIQRVDKLILISSLRDKNDLHPIFRQALKLNLYRLIPNFKIPFFTDLAVYFLNSGDRESKKLLKEMTRSTNLTLMKWSMEKIDHATARAGSVHTAHTLIGLKDKLIHAWSNPNTITIDSGGHFIVYNQATTISNHLWHVLGPA